ncbi:hypothetical protein CAOG_07861 [Capsaspora owczarzaki ATCC 30864]|uniref:F-box domain-containing protein n=1 Tax=Capsaspora owczarzaki (strain ATCC 30864) TaxID=595528 RepID=A0A0D2WY27_CAPO3|nr:hypothetical protein CAOG_07861 [Capsaspora owczarzaki ATCC 30864]KJE97758.1 hypothetical protein CAOG_007861 [Capsaspora owczarzaki ATCC 30864]|eukprot:XP_004342946.1 hypothetical protein CAOG_07861 [Capsaspora owczarzaki ATCC 30864]
MSTTTIDSLPDELLELILVAAGDMPHLYAVCRRWRAIGDELARVHACKSDPSGFCSNNSILRHHGRHPRDDDWLASIATMSYELVCWYLPSEPPTLFAQQTRMASALFHGNLAVCKKLAPSVYATAWAAPAPWYPPPMRGHVGLQSAVNIRGSFSLRQLAAVLAAASGKMDVVEWTLAELGVQHLREAIANAAIWGGHRRVFEAILQRFSIEVGASMCRSAVIAGRMDLVHWLRSDFKCPWDCETLLAAAENGHLTMLQYALKTGCPPPSDSTALATAAARGGQLAVLKWLSTRREFSWNAATAEQAAANGHLAVLQFLQLHDCPWDEAACAAAARFGHLAVLCFLREHGCPWNAKTCASAARGGHFVLLQWARAANCPWDASTCSSAALGGHYDVLRWARANNCAWDENTCSYAAGAGHLRVLNWARTNGCPWNSTTCEAAAVGGHLDVLQWARRKQCPWDVRTIELARQFGHTELASWAANNGCPEPPITPIDWGDDPGFSLFD